MPWRAKLLCETQGQELGFAPDGEGKTGKEGRKESGRRREERSQPDHRKLRQGEFKDIQSCPLLDWNLFALVSINLWAG